MLHISELSLILASFQKSRLRDDIVISERTHWRPKSILGTLAKGIVMHCHTSATSMHCFVAKGVLFAPIHR